MSVPEHNSSSAARAAPGGRWESVRQPAPAQAGPGVLSAAPRICATKAA